MTARPAARLRASPSFVQTATLDGRPYVAKETEPYVQYWLSERERVLLSLFSARHGSTVDDAVDGWFRLTQAAPAPAERRRVLRDIAGMQEAGVLMDTAADTSRYDKRIVADYVAHRPFPADLARWIVERGAIGRATRVLDLAGGPGDLSLALAQVSGAVSMMELSRAFLAAARQRARLRGLPLTTVHDSCNRLVFRDEPYDVVTVSQALHWLDDVQVCRGLTRVLQPGGSFFVVHSAIELPDTHPLAYLLGHDSILGRKARRSFSAEVQPLLRRLTLLFQALDAPDVQRVDPTHQWAAGGAHAIGPAGVGLFTQTRPFDAGYARGFLTPQHIAVTGQAPADFWRALDARCAAATPAQMLGTHRWAVLHFQRGVAAPVPLLDDAMATAIRYDAPGVF